MCGGERRGGYKFTSLYPNSEAFAQYTIAWTYAEVSFGKPACCDTTKMPATDNINVILIVEEIPAC